MWAVAVVLCLVYVQCSILTMALRRQASKVSTSRIPTHHFPHTRLLRLVLPVTLSRFIAFFYQPKPVRSRRHTCPRGQATDGDIRWRREIAALTGRTRYCVFLSIGYTLLDTLDSFADLGTSVQLQKRPSTLSTQRFSRHSLMVLVAIPLLTVLPLIVLALKLLYHT